MTVTFHRISEEWSAVTKDGPNFKSILNASLNTKFSRLYESVQTPVKDQVRNSPSNQKAQQAIKITEVENKNLQVLTYFIDL